MPTRLLVVMEVYKWVKLITNYKRLIKGKTKGNCIYRTGPICTNKINCSE